MKTNADKSSSSVSDFEFLNQLGKGSFGTVYRVKRISDGTIMVLKQINISQMSAQLRTAALNEVKILSSLDSPFIVKYYDSFIEKNDLNILMEYCDGGDLAQYLKQLSGKPLVEPKIWKFFIQLCIGLDYLHQKKILHRDIKALNVFLTKDENVRIGDLGVAKVLADTTNFAHTMVGTPYYLSPEMAEEKPYNEKSDVWALGCVLYEMCTHRHPFEASNQAALFLKIIRGKYVPIPSTYSTDLAELIDNCLCRNYKRRFSTTMLLSKPAVSAQAKSLGLVFPEPESNKTEGTPAPTHQRKKTGVKTEKENMERNNNTKDGALVIKLGKVQAIEVNEPTGKEDKSQKTRKSKEDNKISIKPSTEKEKRPAKTVSEADAKQYAVNLERGKEKKANINKNSPEEPVKVNLTPTVKQKPEEKKQEPLRVEVINLKDNKPKEIKRETLQQPFLKKPVESQTGRNVGRIRKGAPQTIARNALQVAQLRVTKVSSLNSGKPEPNEKKEHIRVTLARYSSSEETTPKNLSINSGSGEEAAKPRNIKKKKTGENKKKSKASLNVSSQESNSAQEVEQGKKEADCIHESTQYSQPLTHVDFDWILTPKGFTKPEIVFETAQEHEYVSPVKSKAKFEESEQLEQKENEGNAENAQERQQEVKWRVLTGSEAKKQAFLMKSPVRRDSHEEIPVIYDRNDVGKLEVNENTDSLEDLENYEDSLDEDQAPYDDEDPGSPYDLPRQILEHSPGEHSIMKRPIPEKEEEANSESIIEGLELQKASISFAIQQKFQELIEATNQPMAEKIMNFFREKLRKETDLSEFDQKEIDDFIHNNLFATGKQNHIVYIAYQILHLENELQECIDAIEGQIYN